MRHEQHDADQWQHARRAAGEIGLRPQELPLWLSSPVRELIVENGAVSGAMVEREGRLVRVNARRSVVLACGGFPHDVGRRKEMFPHAPTGNEHLARPDRQHRRRLAAGGIDQQSWRTHCRMRRAAWVPVSITTRKDGSKGVMPHFIDRAKPGVIAVTRDGLRFANEGNAYHDFVQDMVKAARPQARSSRPS